MKKNLNLLITFLLIIISIGVLVSKVSSSIEENKDVKTKVLSKTNDNFTKTETENEVIYEIIDDDLTYSWTFDKNDDLKNALKDNMEIDMDLKLDIVPNIQDDYLSSMVSNDDLLVIKFSHHGEIPTKAKITLDVNDKYKNGERLYLYYLNEEEEQIEYIDKGLEVKNGKVEFTIEHCSNYFLTGSIVQEAVNNPKNINLIIIVMVVVIIVLIASTLFQNKK